LVWLFEAMPIPIEESVRPVCSSPLGPSWPRVSWNPGRMSMAIPEQLPAPSRSHRPGWGIRRLGPLDTRSLMTTATERFLGIDVSENTLDVHARPDGTVRQFDNTPEGLDALLEWARPLGLTLIVVEASGGYERALLTALSLEGLPVSLVNPKRVRDFAKAIGRLAKTDALDAAVLARFADSVR